MNRKASLSDVQRARIVTLHEEGHSERKIAVKMACSKTTVHTTINNFELYGNYSIPIRKRVVGREKLHLEMTTWWNWLFQDFQPVLAKKKKKQANLLQKGFWKFLKQVSLYFLQELVGDLESQFHHVVISTWSFSRPTTLFLIGIIAIEFKIIDGSMDSSLATGHLHSNFTLRMSFFM